MKLGSIEEARILFSRLDSLHLIIESRAGNRVIIMRSSIGRDEYNEVKKNIQDLVAPYKIKIKTL